MKCKFIGVLVLTLITALISAVPVGIEIAPTKGLIIFTAESWGCLERQEVIKDVTSLLIKADKKAGTIRVINNPEDVFNRYEFYLAFPAGAINGLIGNFVARFGIENQYLGSKAFLSLDAAKLYQRNDLSWAMALRLKGNDSFSCQMFYSRNPEMVKGWVSCSKARNQQPTLAQYFNVFPLEGVLGGMPQGKLSGKWQNIELSFNPSYLEQSIELEKCVALFDLLATRFSIEGDRMLWKFEAITPQVLREFSKISISSFGEQSFRILIKLQDQRTIYSSLENFVPHLKQPLAVKQSNGNILSAELWLRAGI